MIMALYGLHISAAHHVHDTCYFAYPAHASSSMHIICVYIHIYHIYMCMICIYRGVRACIYAD